MIWGGPAPTLASHNNNNYYYSYSTVLSGRPIFSASTHTWAPAYTPTYTAAQYTIYNLTDYEPGAFAGGIEQCKRNNTVALF